MVSLSLFRRYAPAGNLGRMVFSVPGSIITFDIPDEWWQFCDCTTFRRRTDFYIYPPELDPHTNVVPVEEIEPPQRDAGTELFQKHRLVAVLLGVQSLNGVVPPVEVLAQNSGHYKYTVRNGFHRFYGSVALGFPLLPVTTGIVRMSCTNKRENQRTA